MSDIVFTAPETQAQLASIFARLQVIEQSLGIAPSVAPASTPTPITPAPIPAPVKGISTRPQAVMPPVIAPVNQTAVGAPPLPDIPLSDIPLPVDDKVLVGSTHFAPVNQVAASPHYSARLSGTQSTLSGQASSPAPSIDWENLIGGKWALWLGATSLFLALAFFLAYTWKSLPPPPPWARVAMGLGCGIAFLIGGAWTRERAQRWPGLDRWARPPTASEADSPRARGAAASSQAPRRRETTAWDAGIRPSPHYAVDSG